MSEMLLGGTQCILASWNSLCHNPNVTEQWRKRWSVDSPCSIHNLQMLGLRTLWGFLNCSKSLVFTFLCTTSQTKALTLKGTWGFHTNLVGKNGDESGIWDKAVKKDLTVNNPEDNKDQDLASEAKVDKFIQSRECMRRSRSSISESVRLWRKLKFHEKGRVELRIEDIRIFLSITTWYSLGYWSLKIWSPHHKSSQKRILSPSPTINRVYLEKSWKTYAMAFQGQWCDHLTTVLTSQPFECVLYMLRMTWCHRVVLSLGNLHNHFPKRVVTWLYY